MSNVDPASPSTPPPPICGMPKQATTAPSTTTASAAEDKDVTKIKSIHQEMEILILRQEIALLQEKSKCKNPAVLNEYEKKFTSLKLEKLGLQLSLLQSSIAPLSSSNGRGIREEAEFNIVKNLRDKVLHKKHYVDLRKKGKSFEEALEEHQQQPPPATRSPKRRRK